MGYTDRTITLTFDELGPDISVTIRNPLLLPVSKLTPRPIPLKDDGTPVNDDDAQTASYEVIAGIITTWNVFDPLADTDVLLGAPSVETVAQLPVAILNALASELGKAAPTE